MPRDNGRYNGGGRNGQNSRNGKSRSNGQSGQGGRNGGRNSVQRNPQRNNEGRKGSTGRRVFLRLLVALIVIIAVLAGILMLVIELYPFNSAKLTMTSTPTVIYDKNGKQFATIAGPGSDDLTYQQIPKNLQNALVSIEDHNFWNSSSINLKGLVRATFVDMWSHQYAQGGSTIQEQLAKMVYLTDKKTLKRKFEQIVLGVQINRHFTKQEILAMYLNRVYLGHGATGAQEAAAEYFGINLRKHPNALTLDQAALLAGLPQAPSAYDPILHPKVAIQRRNQVLAAMAKYGYISEATAKKAEAQKLKVSAHGMPGNIWDTHPLFAQVLFDYASKNGIDPQSLTQGGLKVYTSIDPKVQNAIKTVFFDKGYQHLFAPPVKGQEVPSAAVFVDPSTGGILGAAGSHSKQDVHGLDRAYEYGQPGSSIKPVLDYGPALETGKWNPNSMMDNTPHNFGGGYVPHNDAPNQPAKVTMSYALKMSENVAAVWMLQQIGINTGIQFAENDGLKFTNKDKSNLGIAIGGMENGVTPMQMARAYEGFDNNGIQQQTYLISKIVNQNGDTTYQFHSAAKRVMSQKTADYMTQMLMGVVSGGTGTGARLPGWDVAGKTGTVQYDRGLTGNHPSWVRLAWFDGYTPNLVGSIYMGWNNDGQGNPAYHTTGFQSYQCSQIFGAITKLAEQGVTPQHFSFGPYQIQAAQTAVTKLTASYSQTAGGVQLNWQSSIAGQADFVISRADGANVSASDSSFQQLTQTSGLADVDATAQPGNVYTYKVQAIDKTTSNPIGPAATVTVDLTQAGGTTNNTTGSNNTNSTTNAPAPPSGGNQTGGTGNQTGGNPPPPTNTTNTTPTSGGGSGNTVNSTGIIGNPVGTAK